MMHSEMMSELGAGVQELSYAHVRRAFPAQTSPIEHLPRTSKVVVEPLHSCTHPGVGVSVFATESRKRFSHDCTPIWSLARFVTQDWR